MYILGREVLSMLLCILAQCFFGFEVQHWRLGGRSVNQVDYIHEY